MNQKKYSLTRPKIYIGNKWEYINTISPDYNMVNNILIQAENNYSQWEQPNETEFYNIGDIVFYKDKNWISTINNNFWTPDVYGWEVIE